MKEKDNPLSQSLNGQWAFAFSKNAASRPCDFYKEGFDDSGFDKIMQDYEATDEAHKPFISSDGENFTLTLPDLTFQKGVVGEDNENPDVIMPCHPFSEYDERVLSCCYTKPRSIIEIASFLGIMPSTYLRKNILEKLVEAGYLFASKKGRAAYYKTITSKVELKRF